ncbi:hypothetical protein KEM48_008136 [Puccinia striiformis f. sp. tritici PST-130]|nr:hypothetical protein Pst134EB_004343 [Puccinia striiformis f. sp. tritici]KAI9620599.1 hypothetical protein KEM48_008136 [Puccinia striiformis f. sp. tritici PST-130]
MVVVQSIEVAWIGIRLEEAMKKKELINHSQIADHRTASHSTPHNPIISMSNIIDHPETRSANFANPRRSLPVLLSHTPLPAQGSPNEPPDHRPRHTRPSHSAPHGYI